MANSNASDPSFQQEELNPTSRDASDSSPDQRAGDNDRIFGEIAEIWKSNRQRDLEARRQIGVLLNEMFGSPRDRQPYGKGVMERLRNQSGLSVSDINLMRWFAGFGTSLDAIQVKYPKVVTWSAFKRELPAMKTLEGWKSDDDSKAADGSAEIRRVLKSLKSLKEKLSGIDFASVNKEELREAVQELVRDLTDRLSIADAQVESAN